MPSSESTAQQRAANIRLLALDVDGILTDGRIIYGNNGEELKAFNIKDGLGIKLLQQTGVTVAIITGRQCSGWMPAHATYKASLPTGIPMPFAP